MLLLLTRSRQAALIAPPELELLDEELVVLAVDDVAAEEAAVELATLLVTEDAAEEAAAVEEVAAELVAVEDVAAELAVAELAAAELLVAPVPLLVLASPPPPPQALRTLTAAMMAARLVLRDADITTPPNAYSINSINPVICPVLCRDYIGIFPTSADFVTLVLTCMLIFYKQVIICLLAGKAEKP